jgi:hypothetical protein
MPYSVHCACGKSLVVSAAVAGTQIDCDCGRLVAVPSLGKLARDAGEVRNMLGTADQIRLLVAKGELPNGKTCVRCQFPTNGVLQCSIECERPQARKRGFWQTLGIYLFMPFQAAYVLSREPLEVHGREVVVRTPLRICADCSVLFEGGRRSSELRKLLASVPEYDALLQQYPRAAILALRYGPDR